MPYGWFESPKTIRLDAEFGRQQMVYRELADDAARDLANGINHLINLVARLAAWQKVIESPDLHEKNELLLEFVQDLASTALLTPYTIKARFYFAVAHLSHQANCVHPGKEWPDDFVTLPEDWGINEQVAAKLAKPWRSWKRLIKALNTVDMGDFKTATNDFRSKHIHRFMPSDCVDCDGIELGRFRLRLDATEDAVRVAHAKMIENHLSRQPGWRGQRLLRMQDGTYCDIAFAATEAEAQAICTSWSGNQDCEAFLALIEPISMEFGSVA